MIATSSDGTTWIKQDSGTRNDIFSIAWNGSKYIAVGSSPDSPNTILSSEDGIKWHNVPSGLGYDLYSITWGNNKFVACGAGGTILISNDGYKWIYPESWNAQQWFNGMGRGDLLDIIWADNKFVIVGGNRKYALEYATTAISNDGLNWNSKTQLSMYGHVGGSPQNVIWDGEQFIASGDCGGIFLSKDAEEWRRGPNITTNNLLDAIWNGKNYIIVGQNSTIINGINVLSESTTTPVDSSASHITTPVNIVTPPPISTTHSTTPLSDPIFLQASTAPIKEEVKLPIENIPIAIPNTPTPAKKTVELTIGSPNIVVNGEVRDIDYGRNTVPVIINNRALVPFRSIIEAFGGNISWEAKEKKVITVLENNTIDMQIDSKQAIINGHKKSLDVPPQIIGDRTMVPIRFVSENLGIKVIWDAKTRKIRLEL